MTRYRRKPLVVEATQWFKNGDHPEDFAKPVRPDDPDCTELTPGKVVRPFHDAGIPSGSPCARCGKRMSGHGQIVSAKGDGRVCPGSWIVTDPKTEDRWIERPADFERTYKEIAEGGQK